jgi:hypothetical protein
MAGIGQLFIIFKELKRICEVDTLGAFRPSSIPAFLQEPCACHPHVGKLANSG